MKDSFFVTKKARKSGGTKVNPAARKAPGGTAKAKAEARNNQGKRKRDADADGPVDAANDDNDDDGDAGAVDDMDLEGDRFRADIDSDDEVANEDAKESAAQKRLRLAKKYIAKMQDEKQEMAPGEFDAQDIDNDLIAERLRDDVLESKGKVFFKIADKFKKMDTSNPDLIRTFGGKKVHQLALTCVDVTDEEQVPLAGGCFIFSASKDGHIVKWDFNTGKKVHEFLGGRKHTKKAKKAFGENKLKKHVGHHDQVLSLAISGDGKFLASGGRDKTIQIWSIPENKHLKTFSQHRDAVAGLSFRYSTRVNQLYSCSYDRTIKLWNIDELSYIETLFGHQDRIEAVDSLALERCVTAGSRDRTVRLWKIVEESQLIFRGGGMGGSGGDLRTQVVEGLVLASEVEQAKKEAKKAGDDRFGNVIDVVAMIDEEHFVSGTDNGAISLWNVSKKKPLFTRALAHGNPEKPKDPTIAPAPCNWITSLACVRYSDLFASGSCDGFVRLWKIDQDKKAFAPWLQFPVLGFINSLRFFEAPPVAVAEEKADAVDEEAPEKELFGAAAKREAARKRAAIVQPKNLLYLAVGTGQEHRLGRWWRVKEARNQLKVITLG